MKIVSLSAAAFARLSHQPASRVCSLWPTDGSAIRNTFSPRPRRMPSFEVHVRRSIHRDKQFARQRLGRGILNLQLVQIEVPALRAGNRHRRDLVQQPAVLPAAPDGRQTVVDQAQAEALQLAGLDRWSSPSCRRNSSSKAGIAHPKLAAHGVEVHVADGPERAPFVGPAVAAGGAFLEARFKLVDALFVEPLQPQRHVLPAADLRQPLKIGLLLRRLDRDKSSAPRPATRTASVRPKKIASTR